MVTATVIGLEMTREEAQQTIEVINFHVDHAESHLNTARKLIWRLKEYNGWKALGYSSWRQCAKEELHVSIAEAYRQLNAALVELAISPIGEIGTIPESVLRPLTKKGYSPITQQTIWEVAQQAVGENGKVTAGVVESVIEGLEDMLASGTVQNADGEQTLIGQQMSADLVARVREKKIAHKEHIRRIDTERDYIVGGRKVDGTTRATLNGRTKVSVITELESSLEIEKLREAMRLDKPIYCSLWTED